MANRAYLLNSALPSSDPHDIHDRSAAAGQDYAEAASAANRIPLAWLCCFRQGDLRSFAWTTEDDGEGAERITTALPVVALSQAVANLRASLPLFEAATGESTLSRDYWQRAVDAVASLPLPYLALNPLEVMYAGDPDEYADHLHAALAGDASALPALKWLSDFTDGVPPYAADVLYGPPGPDRDPQRLSNAVALDAAVHLLWIRAPAADTRDPASAQAPVASASATMPAAERGARASIGQTPNAAGPGSAPPGPPLGRPRAARETTRETKQIVWIAVVLGLAYAAFSYFTSGAR